MTNLSKFQGVATETIHHTSGTIVGRYHQTSVAEKQQNKIRLDTGGWQTRTTKIRMNQFSNQFCNGAFSVYQKNHDWFVRLADGTELPFTHRVIEFEVK
jgi:hypothetical protein